MVSFYTVVQYVPDPVRDERVNIGVLTFADGSVYSRFISNWSRVRAFGGEDIDYLRDFVARAAQWGESLQLELPGLQSTVPLNEAGLREIADRWINSIQFTPPKASVLQADALLDDLAPRLLRSLPRRRRAFRDRRSAAYVARNTLETALRSVAGKRAGQLVRRNLTVRGALDQHRFDVGVQNTRVLVAAQGLSFEGPPSRELAKEVDATAWAVDDIRKRNSRLHLAVVALPPRKESKLFETATRIFDGLGATVVPEEQAPEWADETARRLARTSSVQRLVGKSSARR